MQSDSPTVKPEPRFPTGSSDEASLCEIKTIADRSSAKLEAKSVIKNDFQCGEFETVFVKQDYTAVEYLSDPYTPAVKPEPRSPADSCDDGRGGGAPYTDIDISVTDVKQECLKNSMNADQITDLLRPRESVWTNPSISPMTPERETKLKKINKLPSNCKQKNLLKSHMISNSGEKPFSCLYCTYSCNYERHLKLHILTHTGTKSFSCSQCTYSCDRKATLKRHMLTHTGIKPFSCSLCTYTSTQKYHLITHLLTHSQDKLFSCSHCTYSCNRKASLKRHMLSHTGIKPFLCSLCTYSCKQKCHLKIHLLTHSKEKPFTCSHCTYSCNQKFQLKRHLLTHS